MLHECFQTDNATTYTTISHSKPISLMARCTQYNIMW